MGVSQQKGALDPGGLCACRGVSASVSVDGRHLNLKRAGLSHNSWSALTLEYSSAALTAQNSHFIEQATHLLLIR